MVSYKALNTQIENNEYTFVTIGKRSEKISSEPIRLRYVHLAKTVE